MRALSHSLRENIVISYYNLWINPSSVPKKRITLCRSWLPIVFYRKKADYMSLNPDAYKQTLFIPKTFKLHNKKYKRVKEGKEH